MHLPIARAGGESPLLDKLILPGTLAGGITSGAAQLRANQARRWRKEPLPGWQALWATPMELFPFRPW